VMDRSRNTAVEHEDRGKRYVDVSGLLSQGCVVRTLSAFTDGVCCTLLQTPRGTTRVATCASDVCPTG
jgi:hypothetical protein